MSTRIYSGYRLAEGTDVLAFSRALREKMDAVFSDYIVSSLVNLAVLRLEKPEEFAASLPTDLDSMSFAPKSGRWSILSLWNVFDEIDKVMNRRLTDFEVGFTSDPQTGRVLAVLFTDNGVFEEAWRALPGVEPYAYWNNSDMPDYVTEEEWEERSDSWGRAIGYRPLIEEMLMFHLHSEGSRWPMAYLAADSAGRREMVERFLPEGSSVSFEQLEL